MKTIIMIILFASSYGEPRVEIREFSDTLLGSARIKCDTIAKRINDRKVGSYPHAYCLQEGKLD